MKKDYITKKNVILGIALILLVALPMVTTSVFIKGTMIMTFVFASLGVSWNLIGGYGAQVSWCHAAFVSIGAYTSAILYKRFEFSPLWTMFLGMGLAYIFATLVGKATFRLRGPFFSISTLAFAEIVRVLIIYFKQYTDGSKGIFLKYTGGDVLALSFKTDTPFYYILLGLMILIIMFTARFEKSKTGYYLGAIKGDEDAALSLGIPTFKIKLFAFQLSAMIASLVGTFYGFYLTYIDPASIASMAMSVQIGTVAIIGGLGTLWGPVLGAFLLLPLLQFSGIWLGHVGGASQALYGLVMVIIVITRPKGIISFFQKSKPTKKNKPSDPTDGSV